MTQLWGTCAVNDHVRPEAYQRELLMFDRLVVPYPADDEERRRWRRPNPADTRESWHPGRLDSLLGILGTEEREGRGSRRLAFTAPWSPGRWKAGLKLGEVVKQINEVDAFQTTRLILRTGPEIPEIYEAVPCYPRYRAWWEEERPQPEPPRRGTAATALVALARPLLLPNSEGRPPRFRLLEVVELACDPDFIHARHAYHEWLRKVVRRIQRPGADLAEIVIDEASMKAMKEELDQLLAEERRVVTAGRRAARWTKAEWACTVVGALGEVADAIAQPGTKATQVLAKLVQFAGWSAGKKAAPSPDRPLTGASVFVRAGERLPS